MVLNNKEINKLIKAFSKKDLAIRIGILGEPRSDSTISNAELGAIHEFGKGGMPTRSFIRQPLIDELQRFLGKSKLFNKKALKKVVDEASLLEWMTLIGIVAEECIAEGFNTGGFGKWVRSDMSRKKNHQTLVETGQLRNSITSVVR